MTAAGGPVLVIWSPYPTGADVPAFDIDIRWKMDDGLLRLSFAPAKPGGSTTPLPCACSAGVDPDTGKIHEITVRNPMEPIDLLATYDYKDDRLAIDMAQPDTTESTAAEDSPIVVHTADGTVVLIEVAEASKRLCFTPCKT